ncbi:MAG: aminotransferase class III-fold pyridoxal phosphate-dependent enzyme, partial [Candidatus Dormibacteria bacterium]
MPDLADRSLSSDLAAIQARFVPRGLTPAHPMIVDHAQGALVWDVDGREYIDFVGGIGVVNVGHGHPAVVAAAHVQLDLLLHTS